MNTYNEDEHVKTVYAHFGLAVYLSQVLEHGLVNALVFLDLLPRRAGHSVPKQEWLKEFDAFMGRHFETTLGMLIRSLRGVISVPQDLQSLLADALYKRNFLAHHYFRERSAEFMTKNGRDEMILELQEAQALFNRADGKLNEAVRPVRERIGLTDEQLEKHFADYKAILHTDL
jgi:hypothetical protein